MILYSKNMKKLSFIWYQNNIVVHQNKIKDSVSLFGLTWLIFYITSNFPCPELRNWPIKLYDIFLLESHKWNFILFWWNIILFWCQMNDYFFIFLEYSIIYNFFYITNSYDFYKLHDIVILICLFLCIFYLF